ncbi:unnamed protein product, partial [Bubo scandiacus]
GFVRTIFTDGEYPAITKSQISAMHSKQGYLSSRFLEFTKEEKIIIMGTADFFALNSVRLSWHASTPGNGMCGDCQYQG